MKHRKFPWFFTALFLLACFTGFILLDTFVVPKTYSAIATNETIETTEATRDSNESSEAVITENSYHDDDMTITVSTEQTADTTYYVADIQVTSSDQLKTAFANGTYGRNIKETTSAMASENQAILAINGDYYGFRDTGYVIRNGSLYRDTAEESTDALVIDANGNFSIVNQSEVSAEELLKEGATQVFSFGPVLVEKSEIAVSSEEEVAQSMSSNPRTAIGQIGENHYMIIVSDGRTAESAGLSLYQLAEILESKGATVAYNLDGGGSSTMVFNGQVVNTPVAGAKGDSGSERSVSDIIYF
ncbi:phosphodiester glycosidase family protein [Candidatus Enterococcus ferrettii]|uniref:phosphodiester glycosidase family protein n=1 Tax=Candidatus Enterococcus ferrettii TaxID=2815324 RepID=UPI001A9B25BA|nr:phosphodiester glycosidase family protein [Enterococcus sp. 665A]